MPVNDYIVVEVDGDEVIVQPHLRERLLKRMVESLLELGVEPTETSFISCG